MRAAWWLFPTAFLLGCPQPSPGTDAGTEQDAGVTLSPVELCARLAEASCELEVRCWPAFTRADRPACVETSRAQCLAEIDRLQASFAAGRVSIDVPQLLACERRLTSSACPPSFPRTYPLDVARSFSDCQLGTGLLAGAVPVGETCDDPVECVEGTFCVKPSGVCRGTCIAWSQLGQPCGIGCAPGLRCDGNVCAPLKTLDERCDSSRECEADLICLGSCRPRRKVGETCRIDLERLSPCEPGLACDVAPFVDGAEGRCVVPGEAFAECRFHWSCQPGLICGDLIWDLFPGSAPQPGFCRPPDGADFNCPSTKWAAFVGDQCAPGLSCDSVARKCRALPARGDACSPSRQNCAGFDTWCKPTGSGDVGVCAGPPSQGELCAVRLDAARVVSIPCASGFCDDEITLQCRPPSRPTGSTCRKDGECISGRCVPQPDMTLRCAPPC